MEKTKEVKVAKKNIINEILLDLSLGKMTYQLARNQIRKLLATDKDNINWREVIPLVLSAKSAALYDYEEEGIDSHEIEEKDLIETMIEKIPFIKR